MRLLLVVPSVGRGGCEEYALTVAAAAIRAGHRVTVCLPRLPATASVWSDAAGLGVAMERWTVVEATGGTGWGGFAEQVREASLLLRRVQPDVALLALPWPDSALGAVVACGRVGTPALVVFQLASALAAVPDGERLACLAAFGRQAWVAVSHDNARYLAASFGLAPTALRVIHNGVPVLPLARERARATARERLAAACGLPQGAYVALTVARLSEDKGHQDLLAADRRLRTAEPHYVWAGQGEAEGQLRAAVRASGLADRVHFIGYRRDVLELLPGADLFLFPTRAEGSSFALLEAMAAGSAIVAADANSNPELVRPGQHGLLYPTGDIDALAASVDWAAAHEAAMVRMGRAARRRVLRRFTAERMLRATLGELSALARPARRRSASRAGQAPGSTGR